MSKFPQLGTLVEYRTLQDQVEPTLVSKTRTDVRWHNGHMVVWLHGKAGYVLWSHCRVVPESEVAKDGAQQPT